MDFPRSSFRSGNEHFPLDSGGFSIKSRDFFDFVAVFNCFVLEAQKELDNVLGLYDYLLVEIRSFPGSFVP